MSDDADLIPIVAEHRRVGIFADQSDGAVSAARAGIDQVLDDLHDPHFLLRYAGDPQNPMEARTVAASKCRVLVETAATERRTIIPHIKSERIAAAVAGLGGTRWCVLDHGRWICDLDSVPALAGA